MSPARSRGRGRGALLAAGMGATVVCAAAASPAAAQEPDVIARGLANPRGMSFGPDGRLYVAEAGRGGESDACLPSPEGGEQCYGATGAISRVNVCTGRVRTVVGRLPSLAVQEAETGDPDPGSNATGPQDVSFDGEQAYFTVGLGADPRLRPLLGRAGARFAALYRVTERRRSEIVADLGAHEAENDPDAGRPNAGIDSNPWSVDATVGERILVTDAGGNDLLTVRPGGEVSTRATFGFRRTQAPPFLGLPPGTQIPYQPVPTGVVRVPGGALVGQLTGFPFPIGEANVFRVSSGRTAVAYSGFTTIVDVTTGADGSVYVLQISSAGLLGPPSPGKLIRVAPDGKRTELAPGRLTQPTGVAVAEDGDVYVSNNGTSPTEGEIVRVAAEE